VSLSLGETLGLSTNAPERSDGKARPKTSDTVTALRHSSGGAARTNIGPLRKLLDAERSICARSASTAFVHIDGLCAPIRTGSHRLSGPSGLGSVYRAAGTADFQKVQSLSLRLKSNNQSVDGKDLSKTLTPTIAFPLSDPDSACHDLN
jgi:hypothetical protein